MLLTASMLRQRVDGVPATEPALVAVAAAVSRMWDTYTGRTWAFGASDEDVVLESLSDKYFWVKRYPVQQLTLFSRLTDGTYEEIAAEKFLVRQDVGRVCRLSSENWPGLYLRASVTGGLNAPPADVLEALVTQAKFMLSRNSSQNIVLRSQGYQGGSTNLLDADIHPLFEAAVRNHERHV